MQKGLAEQRLTPSGGGRRGGVGAKEGQEFPPAMTGATGVELGGNPRQWADD